MKVRPGPESLEHGLAPAGIVLRIYNVDNLQLLVERRLPGSVSDKDLDRLAREDADFTASLTERTCIVAYDGDTGARWTPEDWQSTLR